MKIRISFYFIYFIKHNTKQLVINKMNTINKMNIYDIHFSCVVLYCPSHSPLGSFEMVRHIRHKDRDRAGGSARGTR